MNAVEKHIVDCVRAHRCHCGEPLHSADQHNGTSWEKVVHCLSCYDGAPDSDNRNHVGRGADIDAATQSWADSVDPWPEIAECGVCEKTVTADRASASTHHGFGNPICDECEAAP